jgi:hypothetical protein
MFLQFAGNGALYAQVARALKRAILHGELKAGTACPRGRWRRNCRCHETPSRGLQMLRAVAGDGRVDPATFVAASVALRR